MSYPPVPNSVITDTLRHAAKFFENDVKNDLIIPN